MDKMSLSERITYSTAKVCCKVKKDGQELISTGTGFIMYLCQDNVNNLTVEMETGVGKTYTYIKTMFELHKAYGWSKFIVIVPSIAIREGVYKSFSITQDHFMEEYGEKIRFFIYNSAHLNQIDQFASDNKINVMIINSQAFNAKGKDARRIDMKLSYLKLVL